MHKALIEKGRIDTFPYDQLRQMKEDLVDLNNNFDDKCLLLEAIDHDAAVSIENGIVKDIYGTLMRKLSAKMQALISGMSRDERIAASRRPKVSDGLQQPTSSETSATSGKDVAESQSPKTKDLNNGPTTSTSNESASNAQNASSRQSEDTTSELSETEFHQSLSANSLEMWKIGIAFRSVSIEKWRLM